MFTSRTGHQAWELCLSFTHVHVKCCVSWGCHCITLVCQKIAKRDQIHRFFFMWNHESYGVGFSWSILYLVLSFPGVKRCFWELDGAVTLDFCWQCCWPSKPFLASEAGLQDSKGLVLLKHTRVTLYIAVVDPWITQVWIVLVHLYMYLFPIL